MVPQRQPAMIISMAERLGMTPANTAAPSATQGLQRHCGAACGKKWQRNKWNTYRYGGFHRLSVFHGKSEDQIDDLGLSPLLGNIHMGIQWDMMGETHLQFEV